MAPSADVQRASMEISMETKKADHLQRASVDESMIRSHAASSCNQPDCCHNPAGADIMLTPPPSPMAQSLDTSIVGDFENTVGPASAHRGVSPPASSPSSSSPSPASQPAIGLGAILKRLRKRVHISQFARPEAEVCLDSMFEQAERLLLGRDGTPRDEYRAVRLLRRVAGQGHIQAQVSLILPISCSRLVKPTS